MTARFATCLGFISLLAVSCLSQQSTASSGDVNGQYLVRFDSADLSTAHVECEIPARGTVKMSEFRTDTLPDGWATFVRALKMESPDGKPVRFHKTSKTDWTLDDNYSGQLHLSYDVDFSFAAKPWKTGNHTAAYYNGAALFTVGRALFVYSSELKRARIQFQLPQGMKVSAPWQREGNADTFVTGGPYLIMHSLVDNTLVIGKHTERSLTVGRFRLQLCLLDSMWLSSDLIAHHLDRILREYLKIFGDETEGIYQITLFKSDGDGGESYLNSFAAVTTEPPRSQDSIVWANTLAHELFHYWNGIRFSGGMENYFNTQWFSEGATEYYANLSLLRGGIIELPQWLDKVNLHASMYLLFKRGAPYDSGLTLVDAGRDKWRNSPGVYDGGAFVALCLDSLIRSRSSNRHSLDDVMKYMDDEYGRNFKFFAVADLAAAIKSSTGVDAADFIDSYVTGTKTIDVRESLSAAGLNAEVYQYEAYANANCNSAPASIAILRGLTGPRTTVCGRSTPSMR